MIIFILSAILSFQSFGQDISAVQALLNFIQQPLTMTALSCEESSAHTCTDVASAVCSIPTTGSVTGEITSQLPEIKSGAKQNEIFDQAESLTYARSPATMAEINELIIQLKISMKNLINQNPNILQADKSAMITEIDETQVFLTAAEFMQAESNRRMTNNPERGREFSDMRASQAYTSKCQDNGMQVNAQNSNKQIVLCPGLIASLLERNPSKQELLNALSFTIGHELGHSIGPQSFPATYSNMAACVNSIKGDETYWSGIPDPNRDPKELVGKGEEIAADYWGTLILAERIADQNISGNDVLRTIGSATDGLCKSVEDEIYTSGVERIQSISRNLTIQQSIGCDTSFITAPTCSLAGRD